MYVGILVRNVYVPQLLQVSVTQKLMQDNDVMISFHGASFKKVINLLLIFKNCKKNTFKDPCSRCVAAASLVASSI